MVAFFSDDIVAKIDAFIADVDGWAGDEFANLVLALPAKRADEISRAMFTVLWHRTPAYLRFLHFFKLPSGRAAITSSTNPYSWACLPDMNISRSVSFSIFL